MWSVEDKVDGYIRSKLLAERAAWKFAAEESKIGIGLTTICPCFVVGPPLSANAATSHEILTQIFTGKLPVR